MSATTRQPPHAHAAQAVFNTYELVEHILLHLPLRPLLLSQRVNKTTRNVVTRSLDIRKALFLEPCSSRPIHQIKVPRSSDNPSGEVWTLVGDDKQIMPLLNPFIYLDIELDDQDFLPRFDPNIPVKAPWYAQELNRSRHNTLLIEGFAIDQSFPLGWLDVMPQAITPTGKLGAMLLSQPSPLQFELCEYLSKEAHSTCNSTIGEIIGDAIRMGNQGEQQRALMSWHIKGLSRFCRMRRTVDEVTGWEMLEIVGELMQGGAIDRLAKLGVIGE